MTVYKCTHHKYFPLSTAFCGFWSCVLPVCFICWRCFLLQCVLFLLYINARRLFVPYKSHMHMLCDAQLQNFQSQLITFVSVFADIHRERERLKFLYFQWCRCSVLCHPCLRSSACFLEQISTWGSVKCCVLQWLELVKSFSSLWRNPGDCCVDATLTTTTDKFKRL